MDEVRARELLTGERSRIEAALAELQPVDSDELSDLDQHPADTATELFEQERDEGLADRLREQLEAIEAAERRLEAGSYGLSVESGEPIPDARLEAIPYAERTAEEQSRFETGR